jgi:hypothetical protein
MAGLGREAIGEIGGIHDWVAMATTKVIVRIKGIRRTTQCNGYSKEEAAGSFARSEKIVELDCFVPPCH